MRVISLDLETYGACATTASGVPLPSQQERKGVGRFHPEKSRYFDKPAQLVLSASVTWPKHEPTRLDLDTLCDIRPGDTSVFLLHDPKHMTMLRKILGQSEVIIGHNLLFDVSYMRQVPGMASVLHKQTLIDTVCVSYLENEAQDERTLKELGPLFGAYKYERTLKDGLFESPLDPAFIAYNAEDTHNTLLLLQSLAISIKAQYPGTDKLGPYCLNYYSDLLWVCIRLLEDGVPFSRALLEQKDHQLEVKCQWSERVCTNHGLQIAGTGSQKTQTDFIERIIKEIALCSGTNVLEHPQLCLTEKKKKVSFNNENLTLFGQLLPGGHPLQRPLRAAIIHNKAQKLRSSFTIPLLYHQRKSPLNRTSALVPQRKSRLFEEKPPVFSDSSPPFLSWPSAATSLVVTTNDVWIAYPSWYPVPSRFSDSDDDMGGTIQARITAKKPAIQTLPKFIKACIRSRYGRTGAICFFDLKQIELRVAALLSGDPTLIRNYQEGLDLHTDRALEAFTVPTLLTLCGLTEVPSRWEDVEAFDDYRQAGKQVNFADLFLSSPETMRHSVFTNVGLDLPLEFFERIAADRPKSRPGLWAWQQAEIALAESQGYRELPFTGISRQYTGDVRGKDKHTVVNFPIQATAASVQIEIQTQIAAGLDSLECLHRTIRTTHQVYDSGFFDLPATRLPELKALIETAVRTVEERGLWARLQDKYGNEVPLQYDFKVTHGPSI